MKGALASARWKRVLAAILCAALLLILVYFKFYYIDWSRMRIHMGQGASESPNGYYRVEVDLCSAGDTARLSRQELETYIQQGENEVYVVGYLSWDPTTREDGATVWSGKNRKVIFFEQYDGSPVTIAWRDDSTVVINDTALKLPHQTFDYRRVW